jgi:hypothetical protein
MSAFFTSTDYATTGVAARPRRPLRGIDHGIRVHDPRKG